MVQVNITMGDLHYGIFYLPSTGDWINITTVFYWNTRLEQTLLKEHSYLQSLPSRGQRHYFTNKCIPPSCTMEYYTLPLHVNCSAILLLILR